MKKAFLFVLLFLIVIFSYVLIGILIPAGVFKSIEPHFDGRIEKIVLPIAGAEDITIDQHTGIAFISADDRRANIKQSGSVQGGIFIMRLNDSIPQLQNITPSHLDDFHPHGISLWREADGRVFLFVINHKQKDPAHVVERFEWRNDSLFHLESIADSLLMTSPNDMVAVGERSFYVSNDHYYAKGGIGRTLEDYLQRAIAYVNYYDGKSFKKATEGIAYPNGMALSPDQSQIFVAATTGRKLIVYDRDLNNGDLNYKYELALQTGADNIETDAQGNLWIGSHPQLLKFAGHVGNPKKFSPSQVLKLSPDASGKFQTKEIFLNDGFDYSGSSVAAVYKDIILIGSVFEDSILFCKLSSN
jgi:arylesterase / paraoxonase